MTLMSQPERAFPSGTFFALYPINPLSKQPPPPFLCPFSLDIRPFCCLLHPLLPKFSLSALLIPFPSPLPPGNFFDHCNSSRLMAREKGILQWNKGRGRRCDLSAARWEKANLSLQVLGFMFSAKIVPTMPQAITFFTSLCPLPPYSLRKGLSAGSRYFYLLQIKKL